MIRRVFLPSLAILSFAWLFSPVALAQVNYQKQAMQQQRPQKIKTGGTLVNATQNQIQITTNTNQSIMVMVGPNTEVSVTGTAEQDYLKSGVIVEFVGEVAKGGAVSEKISHLVVVTPTTDRPIGLYPPGTAVLPKKGENDEKGGNDQVKPAPAAGIGDAPAKSGKKHADSLGSDPFGGKPAKAQSSAPKPPGTFAVRGKIKLCKDGKISLSAGRSNITAELASDATIDVVLSDLHAAQRDDKVTVNGLTTQARPNFVLAESIKIELANPLTGSKKHAARPAKASTTETSKAKKAATDASDPLGGGK